MEFFAGYGFNKSHSTAYAFLAYQTAYLKANYPVALHGGAADDRSGRTPTSWRMYLGECRDLRHPVLPPDINASQLRVHRRADDGVRFGLTRDQERRRRRDRVDARRAQGAGPHRLALRALRGPRSAAGQQARAREPGQGGRVRLAAAGGRRLPSRRAARGSSRRSTGRSSTAAGTSAIATRGRSQLFGGGDDGGRRPARVAAAGGAALDRDAAARRSRRKRSAST